MSFSHTKNILPLFLYGVFAAGTVAAAGRWEVTAGKFVRFQTLDETHSYSLLLDKVELVDRRLALTFSKRDMVKVRERALYEKIRVYMIKNGDIWEPAMPMRVELIPDEFADGNERVRTDDRNLGPFASQSIIINSTDARTDVAGRFIDNAGMILRLFDLFPNDVELSVEHDVIGKQVFVLQRDTFFRLVGVFQETSKASSRVGVQYSLDYPVSVAPGETLSVTFAVDNQGDSTTCNVGGCLFSRHSWLDFVNFYIGDVAGKTDSWFSRVINVPADAKPGTYYAAFGAWDNQGPIKAGMKRLVIEVKPGQSQ